jgi:hypothetical protein
MARSAQWEEVIMDDLTTDRRTIVPPDVLASWLSEVANGDWTWVQNSRCKYVTLKIDTRAGAYQVLDRDDKPLAVEELLYQHGRERETKHG